VSPVKYELGFYIPEDDIFHSHRRGRLQFYTYVIYYKFANFISIMPGVPQWVLWLLRT
jgi:hypothetical protein